MGLVNDAKNRELTIAMKTARDLHTRSKKPKADALFVNTLEEQLLVMNEAGRGIHIHSWTWQFIPVVGAAALVTILSWKMLKPHRDISYGKEGGKSVQTYVIEEPGNSLKPVLSPQVDFRTSVQAAAAVGVPLVSSSTK